MLHKLPNILLNMIVKDEEHVIKETLISVGKYIDYYVISDTGSSDNTKNVIKNYFDSIGVQGEIFDDEWKNFGHNRSLALRHAKGKSKYIWIIDADDLVVGNPEINIDKMNVDSYFLNIGKNFRYPRKNIVKNFIDYDWFYVGILHEFIYTNKPLEVTKTIGGDYYIDSRRLGDRSKNPKKYEEDADKLQNEVKKNPNNERNVFYCAQSFYDCKNYAKAEHYYTMRTKMGGYSDEIYYSLYKIGAISENTDRPWSETERKYLDVFKKFPDRLEPIYRIALHYYYEKKWELAYLFCDMGGPLKSIKHNSLFVTTDVYTWRLLEVYALSAFYTKRYAECYRAYESLISTTESDPDKIPSHTAKRIKKDYEFILPPKKVGTCLIYFGNQYIREDNKIWEQHNIVALLSKFYDVSICGNRVEDIPNTSYFDVNYVEESIINNNEFDLLVSVDCVNGIINNFKTMATTNVIYLNNTSSLDYYFDDGIVAHVYDNNESKKILDKVDVIICRNINIMQKLFDNYQMKRTASIRLLNSVNSLDFSTFNMLPFLIKEYKKTKEFIFKTNSHKINFTIPNKFLNNNNTDQLKRTINRIQNDKYLVSEIMYEYGKLLNKKESYEDARNILKMALVYGKNKSYSYNIIIQLCISDYYLGNYKESFALASETLKRRKLTLEDRNDIRNVRDWSIDKIKDNFAIYPVKIAKAIKKMPLNHQKRDIVVIVTSCKRIDLFKTTINSFLRCNMDLDLIDRWICIDDNSSKEDRIQMQNLYPFFDFLWKSEHQKGHVLTMNILRNVASQYKYMIHLEDDFHFIEKRNYVRDALEIFNEDGNENIKQVQFNKNYAEIEPYRQNIIGGHELKTSRGQDYILHEYHPRISAMNLKHGQFTNCKWPHYSFRPSLTKTDIFTKLGTFHTAKNFEREYADLYFDYGFKTAFFNSFCCLHTGKKTWEKNEELSNAYALNDIKQFDLTQNNFEVKVISSMRKLDNYVKFKNTFSNNNLLFGRVKTSKLNNINDILKLGIQNKNNSLGRNELEVLITFQNLLNNIRENDNKNGWYLVMCSDIYNNTIDVNKVKMILDKISNNSILAGGCYLIKADKPFDNFDKIIMNLYNNLTLVVKNYNNVNGDNDDNNEIAKDDDYIFYDGFDSHGHDDNYYPNKTIDQLKSLCKDDPNIIGFNTLGYTKKSIFNENNFSLLPKYSYQKQSGLFVKKSLLIIDGKINNIIDANNEKLDITFTMTTCKRLSKFIETMDSLLTMCSDLHLIKEWLVIDDHSSANDIKVMTEKYPFLNIIVKDTDESKGHAISMNMIIDHVKTKFVMHFEDDWKCMENFEIQKIIKMMELNLCDQMILKKQFGNHPKLNDISSINIYEYKYNKNHQSLPNHYKKLHENTIFNSQQNWWWPGFTLNPSIINLDKIKQLGLTFDENCKPGEFEYLFAVKAQNDGFNVCFIDNKIQHIGYTESAYDLNGQIRAY
jgi:hypothetical protein